MHIVMDILSWLGWALLGALGLLWSIAWFLVSGWVATLLQIALLVAAVFFLKYGWQRAPGELWRRGSALARFAWKWLRARDGGRDLTLATTRGGRESVRIVRVKEFGDINISTLMSLLALAGLLLLAAIR
jgi:hypothetical protein